VASKYKVGDLVFWAGSYSPPDIGLITKIWVDPELPRGHETTTVRILWLHSNDGTDMELLEAIETSPCYLTQQEWEEQNNVQT
jgi:hypothetical protein